MYIPLEEAISFSDAESFDFVMSLCETRNKTTSEFSFLIGIRSSRHQKGAPKRQNQKFQLKSKHQDWKFEQFFVYDGSQFGSFVYSFVYVRDLPQTMYLLILAAVTVRYVPF